MADIRLKVSPPWVTFINEVEMLFDGDPQIACNVNYGSANPSIILACNNGDKVTALQQILPEEVTFGGVKLTIGVDGIPSNRAFAYAVSPADDGYAWFSMVYVVFKNCVVQFFNDNLNDCHGVVSMLYEDIARDILTGPATDGVYFNTDVERGQLGMPLGEWP